jgi:hypothetical protein
VQGEYRPFYFSKQVGVVMKFADLISKKNKRQLSQINSPKKSKTNPSKKANKEEKINWHELMGSNNRGLVRGKGGALKRK